MSHRLSIPKRVPVEAAKRIAKKYNYDQVIILCRRPGTEGTGWITTYGVNKDHCNAAANIGNAMRGLEDGTYILRRNPNDSKLTPRPQGSTSPVSNISEGNGKDDEKDTAIPINDRERKEGS